MSAVGAARSFLVSLFLVLTSCAAWSAGGRWTGKATIDRLSRNCYVVDGVTNAIIGEPGFVDVPLKVGDTIIVQDTSQTVNDGTGLFVFGPYTQVTLTDDTSDLIAYRMCYGSAEAFEYDNTPLQFHNVPRSKRHGLAGRRRRKVSVKSSSSISPTSSLNPKNGYSHQFKVTASDTLLTDLTVRCSIGKTTVTYGNTIKRLDEHSPEYGLTLSQEACSDFASRPIVPTLGSTERNVHIAELPSGATVLDSRGNVVSRSASRNVELSPSQRLVVQDEPVTVQDSSGYFVFGNETIVTFLYDDPEEIGYELVVGSAESVERDVPVVGGNTSHEAGRRRRKVNVRSSSSISPSTGMPPQGSDDSGVADRYTVKASVGNLVKVQVKCDVGTVTIENGDTVKRLSKGGSYSYTVGRTLSGSGRNP